jgi:hypothetical protein
MFMILMFRSKVFKPPSNWWQEADTIVKTIVHHHYPHFLYLAMPWHKKIINLTSKTWLAISLSNLNSSSLIVTKMKLLPKVVIGIRLGYAITTIDS